MRFVDETPNGHAVFGLFCVAPTCHRDPVKVIVDDDGGWTGEAACGDESHVAVAVGLIRDRGGR